MMETADAHTDRMYRAATEQLDNIVTQQLQPQPAAHLIGVINGHRRGTGITEEIRQRQQMYMEAVALYPFTTIHQAAHRPQPRVRGKTGDLFQRLHRAHLIGDRTDTADTSDDIRHLIKMAPLQKLFKQARRLINLQPQGLDTAILYLQMQGAFTLDTTRGRTSPDRNRTAAVALMLLTLVGAALTLPALLQFGTSTHRKLYKKAEIGFLILLGVIAVAVSIARLLEFTQIWYVGALLSVGTRSLAHWLPFSTPILWFFCVTFWFGSYLILGRVFQQIEFPREKTMSRFAEEY